MVEPLASAVDIGEQELEPKNNSLVYEKDEKHGVGLDDAISKFDKVVGSKIETEGSHIVND